MKVNKGIFNGTCNMSSCTSQKPATWYNHGSYAYYCKSCAMRLNADEYNKRDAQRLFGHELCTEGEKHKSIHFVSENGNVATVIASENMSDETKTMLSKVVEKAYLIDSNPELEKLPCHACQGGGCPVCSGFGYYCAD